MLRQTETRRNEIEKNQLNHLATKRGNKLKNRKTQQQQQQALEKKRCKSERSKKKKSKKKKNWIKNPKKLNPDEDGCAKRDGETGGLMSTNNGQLKTKQYFISLFHFFPIKD